jgi:dihydrofolate reductase
MMVQSLDGNITHGNNNIIYNWTSPEDSARFFAEVASHNLIIMGAKTYEAAREKNKTAIRQITYCSYPSS